MEKKINLPDLTFFILYRQDTIERVENILLATQYLIKNFKTNIEVLQCDPFIPLVQICNLHFLTTR